MPRLVTESRLLAAGWLRAALANLEAEADYIAEDNPAAAHRAVQKILRAIDLLTEESRDGPPRPSCGTREPVVSDTPYILPYRVRANAVEILRVFHAARSRPTGFEARRTAWRAFPSHEVLAVLRTTGD